MREEPPDVGRRQASVELVEPPVLVLEGLQPALFRHLEPAGAGPFGRHFAGTSLSG